MPSEKELDHLHRIVEALEASDRLGTKTIPQYLDYEAPPVNETEWLRYSCIPVYSKEEAKKDPVLSTSMAKALSLVSDVLSFRVGFLVVPLSWDEEGYPVFPFDQKSENLRRNLEGCEKTVLFAATIGSGIDRLIRRYEKADPRLGLLLQGLGAERVESLCDCFNAEVEKAAAGMRSAASDQVDPATRRRYSPGYGDLPIEVQREFLPLLDAERRLGITLSDSCLMAPSKSVTAIIGIDKEA